VNALFRKEWHENRAVVPMSALLMTVLFCLSLVYRHYATGSGQPELQASTLFEPLLLIFWAIPAALCSTSIIASEAGAGTLQFLSSIPISRNKVWCAKMLTAFFVVALCALFSAAVFSGLYEVAVATRIIGQPLNEAIRTDGGALMLGLFVSLPIFAIGAVATVLVDRTITAMVLLIVISAVISIVIMGVSNLVQTTISAAFPTTFILVLLTIAVSLLFSNRVFVRGATRVGPENFKIFLAPVFDVIVLGGAIWFSIYWLMH
jgi:ABC-type transport system involved in multi-copper enzyme maturation permease subunit